MSVGLGLVCKFDDEAQVAYGWASVVSEHGVPYVDDQGDIITPAELLRSTTRFMLKGRAVKFMHQGGDVGTVVHSMPLTRDLASSFGIRSDREGWLVGVRIESPELWREIKAGAFKAFSIGARANRVEV